VLTHQAPPFVLNGWSFRPGKTGCDAHWVSLRSQHAPGPCHLVSQQRRMSSAARQTSYISLAAGQEQAHRLPSQQGHQSAPRAPPRTLCTPQHLHGGKVSLCSFHLGISPAYRSVKLDTRNMESCPVAGR